MLLADISFTGDWSHAILLVLVGILVVLALFSHWRP